MTAVTNDVAAGMCGHLVPRARAAGRHLSVVRLSGYPPVDGFEDLRAALEELGRKLDELARRQGTLPP